MLRVQRGKPIVVCLFWRENLWRCSIIELFPSSGSHKHCFYFLGEFDRSKVFFG